MKGHLDWRYAGVGLAMLMAVFIIQPAQALTIWQLDAAGNRTQYDPGESAWVLTSDAYGAANTTVTNNGGDYEIALATGDWAAAENDSQQQAIWGAGLLLSASAGVVGWEVDFTTQLYTWDSYGLGGVPGGYWDLFAINLNDQNYYWNIIAGIGDPVVTPDPSGAPINTNDAGNSSNLPGETWAWGGFNYSGGGFEQLFTSDTLTILSTQSIYLSAILDSLTTPDSDQAYPSYGAFNPGDDVPPPIVPEPASMTLMALGIAAFALRRNLASRTV